MGDMADYYRELYEDWDNLLSLEEQYESEELYWTTKNGREILVQDIPDDHLDNIIKMLERNKNQSQWIEILKLEQNKRSIN